MPRVLLIDDDKLHVQRLASYLDRRKFTAEVCDELEKAHGLLRTNIYDIIIIKFPAHDAWSK